VTRSLAVSSDNRIGPRVASVCRTPKVVKLFCSTDASRMNIAVNCSMARPNAPTSRPVVDELGDMRRFYQQSI
jgi:hypothetical protein